ncbi:MAG: metallophosphoesterase [Chloroflexia bacterium]|nr:metallophosphoesterase [Chloroflexia bacterium]
MNREQDPAGPATTRRQFDPPARIGVIADTHIYPRSRRQIPDPVIDLFQRARIDLIVHLGDVTTRPVLEDLAHIAPLIAVHGNNDDDELAAILPRTTKFMVGTHRFGVVHGHGGRSARQVARETFTGKVDCVLFGHSHQPLIDRAGDLILFNPGSATDRRWHDHFGVGIIDVTAEGIEPELILYASPDHLANITFNAG